MMKPKSRKQQIIDLLVQQRHALTMDELSAGLHLPEDKIRQSINTYEANVVRIGYKLFDLPQRILKGKMFRYSPTPFEFEHQILNADEDLSYFLTGWRDHWATIHLTDMQKRLYQLKRVRPNKNILFSHYSKIERLFNNLKTKPGDDLLFTCLDLSTHTFLVTREEFSERKILEISVRNRHLCDMVYDILLHAYSHYEDSLFLVRKYLFIYPYFTDPPPNHLRKVISSDPRFLITPRDRMYSPSNHLMDYSDMIIGLKKYFLKNETNEYVPVFIDIDEEFGGKVAYCTRCDERLIWDKTGWRHCVDEMEWIDAYVPKEFFHKENTRIIH